MDIKVIASNRECSKVTVSGECDVDDARTFRDVVFGAAKTVEVDLEGLERIDASGLGILLLAADKGHDVVLRGAKGQVERVIRNFRIEAGMHRAA